jgi:hypothetical protein
MVTRGKPGRKRKLRLEDEGLKDNPASASASLFEWNHTDEVIQASLVLETMSRTPRYEEAAINAASNGSSTQALSLQIPKYLTFNHRRQ